jgi:hypothetical protein
MQKVEIENDYSHWVLWQNYERRQLGSLRMSVCPSVRMELLGSQRKDFNEIWFFSVLRKSFEKVQASLKSAKNNGHFTWRPCTFFDHISLTSS